MSQEYFVGGGAISSSYGPKNNKRIVAIVLAIILVIVVAVATLLAVYRGASSESIGSGLIVALQNNRSDEAYDYMSGTYKSTINKNDWTKFVGDASALMSGGQVELKFTDISIKTSSYYTYRINTKSNGTVNVEMRINNESRKVETLQINRTTL